MVGIHFIINPAGTTRDLSVNPVLKHEIEKRMSNTEDKNLKISLASKLQKLKNLESQFLLAKPVLTFKVIALQNYKTIETGFLDLSYGDVITVIDNSNPIWWYGDLNGKLGYFPSHIIYGGPIKLASEPYVPDKIEPSPNPIAVVATTDYEGQENELSYKRGNIIFVIDADPKEEYWEGFIDKKMGYFHKSNVVLMETKKLEGKKDRDNDQAIRGLVLYDYKALTDTELCLMKGSIIHILENPSDKDWWQGSYRSKTGFFPRSYVEIVPNDAKSLLREASVLYDYEAQSNDELNLTHGEKVFVLESECSTSEEWWEGRKEDGSHGFFPRTFIQIARPPERRKSLIIQSGTIQSSSGSPQLPRERDSPVSSKRKRLSRGKIMRKESLRGGNPPEESKILKKVTALVGMDNKHASEEKTDAKLLRLEVELNNEKMSNHHLNQQIKEYSEVTMPNISEENKTLKSELAQLRKKEKEWKAEREELMQFVSAFRDAHSLIEMEEKRTATMKELQEVLYSELSNVQNQLLTERLVTDRSENNREEKTKMPTSGPSEPSKATANTVAPSGTEGDSRSGLSKIQEELNNEMKKSFLLQQELLEVKASFTFVNLELEEKRDLVARLEGVESEYIDLSAKFEEVSNQAAEWQQKCKLLELRNEELKCNSESAKSALEIEIEEWKTKHHSLMDKLDAKRMKYNLLKQKYQELLQKTVSIEINAEGEEKKTEVSSKRRSNHHHAPITISSPYAAHTKDEAEKPDKPEAFKLDLPKAEPTKPDPLRPAEDDEQSQTSFLRAQKFFAVRETAGPRPDYPPQSSKPIKKKVDN
uniref:SH3 domain-containing protein n=1 Tax=Arcella intermedia TaxID=1963864 RepID=A0A6B2KXS4_9EUKA